ncbi:Hint domain-containing protein, partial [Flammeovirga aprica]
YIEAVGLPEHELVAIAQEQLGLFAGNLSTPQQLVERLVDNYGSFLQENAMPDCHELIIKLQQDPRYAPFFVEGSAINTAIINNLCVLQNLYSIGEGLGYETAFMSELNDVVGGVLNMSLGIAGVGLFLPVLGDVAIDAGAVNTMEWLSTKGGKKIAKDALRDAMFDLTFQFGVNLLLEPILNDKSIDELTKKEIIENAWKKIDWTSVSTAYINNKISDKLGDTDGKLGLLYSASTGCISSLISTATFDGTKAEIKSISFTEGTTSCIIGSVGGVIGWKFSQNSERIVEKLQLFKTKLATQVGSVKFISLCRKLGINAETKGQIETFLRALGFGESSINTIMRHFCFPAGTQIYANGKPFKPIEKIVGGDYVDTKNNQGKRVLAKVLSTKVSFADSLVILYHGNKKLLTSTPNHQIFTPAGFKKARDFIEGDEVEDVHGKLFSIDSIATYTTSELVYNFEVEGYHSYYADGIYVHNDYALPELIAKKLDELKLDDKLRAHFINDYNKGGEFKKYFDEVDSKDVEGAIDAWVVLKNANVDETILFGKNGGLVVIQKYLRDSRRGISEVTKEIKKIGSYELWAKTPLNKQGVLYIEGLAQTEASIIQRMNANINSTDVGKQISATTAKKLKEDAGIKITDLDNELRSSRVGETLGNPSVNTAGDRDLGTLTHLIEVKASLGSVSFSKIKKQINKMVGVKNTEGQILYQFMNPEAKKVIIYTEERLSTLSDPKKIANFNRVKNYAEQHGAQVIDNYNDLLKELQ